MAQAFPRNDEPQGALSERIEQYRQEIQSLVKQGVEHPQFEFKRSCSISRDNFDDRLDFIKFLQGVANAEVAGERCITIGADPKEKRFYPVSNCGEFDPAVVSGVVAKYLDPPPRFHVFNNLQTDEGQPFVLVVLDANQPRPIVIKTEGQKPDGKVRLQVGEIWIKRGTALLTASRVDIDSMYKQRIEEEAEDRARKRFKHFGELSGTASALRSSAIRLPVREFLVGPAPELQRFTEELIATSDRARFRMLLELARESLVQGWDHLNDRGTELASDPKAAASETSEFFRDEFLPSLQSVVTLGLLVVKYDFEVDWLSSIVGQLLETFEASRSLQLLKSGYVIQEPGSLPWWRPAFEIYVGLRCIAAYALSRGRPRFLETILPRFVTRLTVDSRRAPKTPILFWPLPSLFSGDQFNDGRNTFYWKERISTAWGKYFGNYEKFLRPACELEFLLELNSHFAINAKNDPKARPWLGEKDGEKSFDYVPDLFAYDLQWTIQMVERCYELIAADEPFPSYLEVEPKVFELAFKNKDRDQRLMTYGGFLYDLKAWQEKFMFEGLRRWPFMYGWEGRLGDLVDRYRAQQLPKPA